VTDSDEGATLSGWDAATWRTATADPTLRSTIGGLFVLDREPDVPRLRERVLHLVRTTPVLRQRIEDSSSPLGSPRLVTDPHFDVSVHLQHVGLPPGGTWQQVLNMARRQSLLDFDYDRPLWRSLLVSGLPGGRAAAIVVVHHALADGQGMVLLLAGLFDWSEDTPPELPETAPEDAAPPPAVQSGFDPIGWAFRGLRDSARKAADLGASAVSSIPTVAKTVIENPGVLLDTAGSVVRMAQPHRTPLSPLLVGRSTTYSYATLDVPFGDLRAACKANEGTLNDGFVAAVLGGLRRYHERHGAGVGPLRMNLPISVRTATSDASENAVTVARLVLDAGELDPKARMAQTHEAVDRARSEPALPLTGVLADASRLLPVSLIADTAKASDFTTSNVPGPPVPVWLAGAQVVRVYPVVPTIGAAVNITLLSYARKTASLGIAADDAAVPDLDVLVACLVEGFAEIGVPLPGNATDPTATDPTADEA
jgi:WS/DGAT/MGAT family acyltransferase